MTLAEVDTSCPLLMSCTFFIARGTDGPVVVVAD
jgi:hypothetical protein